MMSTHLRISTLAILFTLVIPAGAVNAGDEAPEVDVFAAALRAGTSISNAKTRAYTIERIALAWAHTDFCEEALVALRAGAGAGAEAALDAALMCAETVADETAGKLLTFARGRVNQTSDPVQKALYLAALAGAYGELEQYSNSKDAAARAAATLPATCDPLEAVLSRTALALRFLDAGMEAWAAHLLAGATRVALDLSGKPAVLDGVWGPDDTSEADLTTAVMGHLRFYKEDAPGFSPPPPLHDCPGPGKPGSGQIDPAKAIALAAVSTVLRRLGDAESAELALLLASAMIPGIQEDADRDGAVDAAATLLADDARAEDVIAFLIRVASVSPNPVHKVFARLVFSGRLRTRAPTESYLQSVSTLAKSHGPSKDSGDRFNTAAARAFLDLGDPVRAFDIAINIGADDLRQPVLMELLPELSRASSERSVRAREGITGPWKAIAALSRQTEETQALEAAWKLSVAVEHNGARTQLLDRIGRHYLRLGDFKRTVGITGRMTGKRRDRLLWSVAVRQLDAGQSVPALETIRDIKSPGHRARAIAEVALRLGKAGTTLDAAGADLLDKIAP